jgi:hypothetical protein
VGKRDWIDKKLSQSEIDFLEGQAKEILEEVKLRYPHVADKADFFAMETCLCSFKKLFRVREGRYLGYYLDRQAEEIKKVEQDDWFGIDWQPMWDARNETLKKRYLTNKIEKSKMSLFLETGKFDPTESNLGLEVFM